MSQEKAGKKSRKEGDGEKFFEKEETDNRWRGRERTKGFSLEYFKVQWKGSTGNNVPFLQQPTMRGRASQTLN